MEIQFLGGRKHTWYPAQAPNTQTRQMIIIQALWRRAQAFL